MTFRSNKPEPPINSQRNSSEDHPERSAVESSPFPKNNNASNLTSSPSTASQPFQEPVNEKQRVINEKQDPINEKQRVINENQRVLNEKRAGKTEKIIKAEKVNNAVETTDLFHLIFRKRTFRDYLALTQTWLFSIIVHLLLIFSLLFCWVAPSTSSRSVEVISAMGEGEVLSTNDFFNDSTPAELDFNVGMDAVTMEKEFESALDQPTVLNSDPIEKSLPIVTSNVMTDEFSKIGSLQVGLTANPLQGRGADKRAMLAAGGGSSGSEKAVGSALEWIAQHQYKDGHWSFNLNRCENCRGQCRNSGSRETADLGATALALLPFLSSGNTPFKGKYHLNVRMGLSWLLGHAKFENQMVSFRDGGNMYSHGMAALALSETYAMMSNTERRRWPAIGAAVIMAAAYIGNAQDPKTGGWRYNPRQAGDTSVTGWQIMALKSTTVEEKDIPWRMNVLKKALYFFKNVTAFDKGSRYGYTDSTSGSSAVTAVGLLCRLYLDWKTDQPELLKGADYLLSEGSDPGNPYFTYYSTLLLFNIGGERWTKWNNLIRDDLIARQEKQGHEKGSWYPVGDDSRGFCKVGGRLYVTALNCMSLQIYYRYLPLYKSLGEDSKFPLE